jgi:hypothetical protein
LTLELGVERFECVKSKGDTKARGSSKGNQMPENPKREVTTKRGTREDNHKTKETEDQSVLSIRDLRSQQRLISLHMDVELQSYF